MTEKLLKTIYYVTPKMKIDVSRMKVKIKRCNIIGNYKTYWGKLCQIKASA